MASRLHRPIVSAVEHQQDSSIQKALHILKDSIANDNGQKEDHLRILNTVYSLLLSSNSPSFSPESEKQMIFEHVPIDEEQEQWVMNEILNTTLNRKQLFNRNNSNSLKSSKSHSRGKMAASVSFFFNKSESRLQLNAVSEVDDKITEFLSGATSHWTLDIFYLHSMTNSRPLFHLSNHLIVESGLISQLGLNPGKFLAFCDRIERTYHNDLPYHNSKHAADVLHTIWFLVQQPHVVEMVSDLETLAIFVAAMIHDVDHPGFTNNFLINTGYMKYAMLYNDRSVLENHHLRTAFELLSESEYNFMDSVSKADYKVFRDTVIDMVLATDLSNHFSIISAFKNKVSNPNGFLPAENPEEKQLLFKMLMKCADVSNPAKEFDYYERWANLVLEEFFRQGDREKELGLPVSPFSDRNTANKPNSQIGFINFICLPLYETFHSYQPIPNIIEKIHLNRGIWMSMMDNQNTVTSLKIIKASAELTDENTTASNQKHTSKNSIRDIPRLGTPESARTKTALSTNDVTMGQQPRKNTSAMSESNIYRPSGLRYESNIADSENEEVKKSNSDGEFAETMKTRYSSDNI